MNTSPLLAYLLAAACALGAAGAQAAESTLSKLTIGAVDLTPTDGATASVGVTATGYELAAQLGNDSEYHFSTMHGSDGAPHNNSYTIPGGYEATATLFGDGNAHNQAALPAGASGGAYLNSVQHFTLTLAAHSELVLSGSASASLQSSPASAGPDLAEFANVLVQVFNERGGYSYENIFQAGAYQQLQNQSATGGSSVYVNHVQTLSSNNPVNDFLFKFDNNSDAAQTFFLSVNMNTTMVDYPTAPVPEPESYLMLGAGLAVLGLVARRRQRS